MLALRGSWRENQMHRSFDCALVSLRSTHAPLRMTKWKVMSGLAAALGNKWKGMTKENA